jgi:hypothetical protein
MGISASRSRVVAALLLLGLAATLGTTIGLGLDLSLRAVLVGAFAGALIVTALHRLRLRRHRRAKAEHEHRLRVLPGGRRLERGYDLAQDDSTDEQRWPM